MRIPAIATTRYDRSRPLIPGDRDQCEGAVGSLGHSQYSQLTSSGLEAVPVVNREGPARAAECHTADAAARAGGALLTHWGGRDDGSAHHFLAPLDDLSSAAVGIGGCAGDWIASVALILRIDGPSSSSR